jgi:alcohol dehydrogenase
VVAVDVSAAALELARERGAEVVLDASASDDIPLAIHEITGGGAHVSLDALGSPATAVASVLSLRRRGRHVQVGLLGADSTPPLPMDRVLAWELSLHGSHGIAAHEYPGLLDLIATAGLDPAALVGQVISLDEAGAALAAMDGPTPAGMTVIALDA